MDKTGEFAGTIMDLARILQDDAVTCPAPDVMSASAIVLAVITRHAFNGTDHIPHPDHSTIEKSTVGASFMAACSVPIAYRLQQQAIPIDVRDLMRNAGVDLFREYSESDRHSIIDGGILLFQELVDSARNTAKFTEWMTSVHSVTEKYIMSKGDTEYVELFAPLYLVLLMAARQFTMQIRTSGDS